MRLGDKLHRARYFLVVRRLLIALKFGSLGVESCATYGKKQKRKVTRVTPKGGGTNKTFCSIHFHLLPLTNEVEQHVEFFLCMIFFGHAHLVQVVSVPRVGEVQPDHNEEVEKRRVLCKPPGCIARRSRGTRFRGGERHPSQASVRTTQTINNAACYVRHLDRW